MSPKESYVLILSFPSVWLCQVNSEGEETLTNPERPSRAGWRPAQTGRGGDRQGLERKDPHWFGAQGLGCSTFGRERKGKARGVCGRPSSFLVLQYIIYTDDTAEMVFELCEDVSKCLGRLALGALGGYLLTPRRGA